MMIRKIKEQIATYLIQKFVLHRDVIRGIIEAEGGKITTEDWVLKAIESRIRQENEHNDALIFHQNRIAEKALEYYGRIANCEMTLKANTREIEDIRAALMKAGIDPINPNRK